jgi:predicted NBD/HSP70 family sugar kinase
LRDLNMSLVIELVRLHGNISRADLARQSKLSPAAITAIVASLVERGILSEVALAPSSGGRPPILLRLNPTAGFVVGIKLRDEGLTTVVCDLDARIVATDHVEERFVGAPDAAIAAIEAATRRVLRKARVARSNVLGVGVGLSGVVDTRRGSCRFSHLLEWRDVDLVEPLAARLRLSVWVDNDVKTLAIAEKWSGDGIDAHNFLTLSIGRGVGLGIVLDRALYRGTDGGAGELGHIVIDPEGPECGCGGRGCLEAFVGEEAIRRRIGERLGREIDRSELVALTKASNLAALAVLAEAGRQLGTAVANAVTLLNPELLIICGEGTELGAPFVDPIRDAVHDLTFDTLGHGVEVKVQQWGDESWAVGAATLVLRETFRIPEADDERPAIWRSLEA